RAGLLASRKRLAAEPAVAPAERVERLRLDAAALGRAAAVRRHGRGRPDAGDAAEALGRLLLIGVARDDRRRVPIGDGAVGRREALLDRRVIGVVPRVAV